MILGIEGRRITSGFSVLDIDVFPCRIIGPAVIRADVIPGVACTHTAHSRALVAAGVDEGADVSICVTRQKNRGTTDLRADEIMWLGNLRFKCHEIPGALKNVLHLQFENFRIGERFTVHAKHALVGTIIDIALQALIIHSGPA